MSISPEGGGLFVLVSCPIDTHERGIDMGNIPALSHFCQQCMTTEKIRDASGMTNWIRWIDLLVERCGSLIYMGSNKESHVRNASWPRWPIIWRLET
jgi:hypothetical protein